MSQPFVYWGSMFLVIFYSFTWEFCTELIIKSSLSCFSDCAGICFVEQQFLFKSTSSLRWKKRNVNLTEYPLEVLAWAYCCGRRSGRKVRHVQPFGRFVLVVWIFVVRRLVVTAAALLSDLGMEALRPRRNNLLIRLQFSFPVQDMQCVVRDGTRHFYDYMSIWYDMSLLCELYISWRQYNTISSKFGLNYLEKWTLTVLHVCFVFRRLRIVGYIRAFRKVTVSQS